MCCHLPVSIKVQLLIKLPAVYKLGDAGLSESAGWSSRVQHANQIQIWPLGAGSTQKRCCLPASCIGAGPNTGKIGTGIPVLAPKLHHSDSLHMSPMPQSHCPSVEAQGEFLRGPFEQMSGFVTAFRLVRIPTVFDSQKLWVFSSHHQYSGLGNLLLGARVPCSFVGKLCG